MRQRVQRTACDRTDSVQDGRICRLKPGIGKCAACNLYTAACRCCNTRNYCCWECRGRIYIPWGVEKQCNTGLKSLISSFQPTQIFYQRIPYRADPSNFFPEHLFYFFPILAWCKSRPKIRLFDNIGTSSDPSSTSVYIHRQTLSYILWNSVSCSLSRTVNKEKQRGNEFFSLHTLFW